MTKSQCVCVNVCVCRATDTVADIYRGAKMISVNCGQVHLHTFLISLDWYQPLSPRQASTGMSSWFALYAHTNTHSQPPSTPLAYNSYNGQHQPRNTAHVLLSPTLLHHCHGNTSHLLLGLPMSLVLSRSLTLISYSHLYTVTLVQLFSILLLLFIWHFLYQITKRKCEKVMYL